jgi:antagonist of KipI
MSSVRVIRGGMLTTIQDSGRWGYQSRGVPVAGPMDPMSHRLANALVGNDRGAATLEVTLLGPELEFEDERVVAVTGADFEITLDGKPALAGAPFMVSAESHLCFGQRRRGARAYLAIRGGVAVPPVLGSRATHLISAMGGVGGRALKAGDRLPLGVAEVTRPTAAPLGDRLVPLPAHPARLRVLPGPQADAFVAEAFNALQSAPYTVGQQSDRMGFRLEGPPLAHARGADIISDATPLGVLQVPASGQPILLMADRQTTGGYPKIATVISADLAVAGQLGPGDTIVFSVCDPHEAMAALIAQERALMALESWRR